MNPIFIWVSALRACERNWSYQVHEWLFNMVDVCRWNLFPEHFKLKKKIKCSQIKLKINVLKRAKMKYFLAYFF